MISFPLPLLVLTLLLSGSASSAPLCMPNTLASFISLGSGGCDIGSATFSGFDPLPPITGATAIAPSAISITPFTSGNVVGLDIRVTATASAGQILQSIFGYQITGPMILSEMTTVSGTASTGDGFVSNIQNFCAGGMFSPDDVSGCPGTSGALVVIGNGVDQTALPGLTTLSVVGDFTLDAGFSGTATGGLVSDRFTVQPASTVIPEPQTYVLLSSALFGIAGLRFAQRRRIKTGGQD